MVYLIIIVVFFFLSFFSFPFILLASRFLSHLSSSLRVFFPFISYKFRAKPLFFCLFSSLSPFPVRHFPSFVSANLGGWEIPLRFSFGISPIFCIRQYWRMGNPAPYPPLLWGLSSLFCARHLRWRVFPLLFLLPLSLPCGEGRGGVLHLFLPIYLHMSNFFCTFASSKTSTSPVLYT